MKRSETFWLALGFVIQIIIGLFSFVSLLAIWAIGSAITWIYMLNRSIEKSEDRDDGFLWVVWFPLFWGLAIIGGIAFGCKYVFDFLYKWIKKGVIRFNRWIDGEREANDTAG